MAQLQFHTLEEAMRLVLFSLTIVVSVLLSFILVAIISTHAQLRRHFRNQQLVNIASAAVLFSVTVRPAVINTDLPMGVTLPDAYCDVAFIVSDFEEVFLPVALLVFTAMTVLAGSGREKNLLGWQKVGSVLTPWLFSVVYALMRRFTMHPDVMTSPHVAANGCIHGYKRSMTRGSIITWLVVICVLVVSLMVSMIVLLVSHHITSRQRLEARNSPVDPETSEGSPKSSEPVDEVTGQFRRVAMVTIVNLTMMLVIILHISMKNDINLQTTFTWCYSLVEIFLCFVSLVALPDINKATREVYCHSHRKADWIKRCKNGGTIHPKPCDSVKTVDAKPPKDISKVREQTECPTSSQYPSCSNIL